MCKIEQKNNFYVQRLSVKFALRIAKCVLWNYILALVRSGHQVIFLCRGVYVRINIFTQWINDDLVAQNEFRVLKLGTFSKFLHIYVWRESGVCLCFSLPCMLQVKMKSLIDWNEKLGYSTWFQRKREVPRGVRNSKVRRQDKFRRDWSRH